MPFRSSVEGPNLLTSEVTAYGRPCLIVCDHRCEKAWGFNGDRPEIRGDDPDDVIWLADDEVTTAPSDPGTYEGGDGKPDRPTRHNKWCFRECERSESVEPGAPIQTKNWAHRVVNQPAKHPDIVNHHFTTGEIYTPNINH